MIQGEMIRKTISYYQVAEAFGDSEEKAHFTSPAQAPAALWIR